MPINPVRQYHKDHAGQALIVMKGGVTQLEDYSGLFFGPNTAKDIESASKTFAGIMSALAVSDGLIPSLDVKLSTVLTELVGTPKENVTLRQILTLTSGWSGGQVGSNPTYAEAIASPFNQADAGRFIYGPNPIHVAGAMFNRLAQGAGFPTWREWLDTDLLGPDGVTIQSWDTVAPGEYHLAGGAHMTCREAAQFGEFMRLWPPVSGLIVPGAYAAYGMNLWLMVSDNINGLIGGNLAGAVPIVGNGYAAAGANNQRIIVCPALGLVVARFGKANATWNDKTFLGLVVQEFG